MTRKKSRLSLNLSKRKRKLETPPAVKTEVDADMDWVPDPTPGGSSDVGATGDGIKKRKSTPNPTPSSSKTLPKSVKMTKALKKKVENLIVALGTAGYDSLLVVVKVEEDPVVTEKFGSQRGRNFLGNRPQLVSEFTQYCTDECREQRADENIKASSKPKPKPALKTKHNVGSEDTSTDTKEQLNVQSKVEHKPAKHEGKQPRGKKTAIVVEPVPEEIILLDNDSDTFEDDGTDEDFAEDEYGDNDGNDEDVEDDNIMQEPSSDTETETFLDFLKMKLVSESDTKLPVNEVDDESESEQDPNDPKEDQKFVNLPKSVLRVVENVDDIKKECKPGKNGKHRCLLCDYQAQGFYVIRRHLDVHVKAIKQPLGSCDKCDAKLPESFIGLHRQAHERTLPPVLDMVKRVDRDITNDVVYFLLQEYHRARQPYQCRYCDYDFTNLDMYRNHFMVQHTYKYACKQCGKSIYTYPQMVQHVQDHKDNQRESTSSTISPTRVVAPGILPGATTTVGGIGDVSITVELAGGASGVDEDKDRGVGSYSCPYCHTNFPTQDALVAHVKDTHINTDFIKFPCTLCKKSFISDSALQEHILKHDQVFRCTEDGCSETFTSKWSRRVHCQQEHGKPLRHRVLCNICGHSLESNSRLKEHMEFKHHGRQPIKCAECGAEYRSSDAYKKHIKTHTMEANFVCDQCGMHFKASHQFSAHKRVHKNIVMFTCNKCGAEFKRRDSFHLHLFSKKHFTPEQPEALIKNRTCPICGKQFANGNHLYKHTESAHGKPQVCPYCSKQLSDKNALRVHIRTHTNQQPRCKICHALFRSKVKLSEHLETKHAGMIQLVSASVPEQNMGAGQGAILHTIPAGLPMTATTVEVVTETLEPLAEGGGDKTGLESLAASNALVTQDATFHQMGNIVFSL